MTLGKEDFDKFEEIARKLTDLMLPYYLQMSEDERKSKDLFEQVHLKMLQNQDTFELYNYIEIANGLILKMIAARACQFLRGEGNESNSKK
jgi:hypothetical protein